MSPERKGYGEVGGKERWLMHSRMFSRRKPRGREKFQARIFAAGSLSPQFWGEDLDHVFSCQIVRLDEDFHVVVPSEPPLCLGSAVYFEKRVLTVITWR